MLSIQEIVDKTKPQLNQIEATMDSWAQFHPDITTPEQTKCTIFDASKPALNAELKESLHMIPLKEILVSGIAGAAYLVPDKLHDELIFYSKQADLCPLIGRMVDGWKGGPLKVNIVHPETYTPKQFAGAGAEIPDSTVETTQATITPLSFAINIKISNDMLENAAYDLIEYHIANAAKSMGEKASELALTVLKTATDGWGTVNGGLSGNADQTMWTGAATTGVDTCLAALTDDRWIPNTMIITTEAWEHSVQSTMPMWGAAVAAAADTYWKPQSTATHGMPVLGQVAEGFTFKIGVPPLDVLLSNNLALHSGALAGATMADCVTIIYDRNNGLLTGRKRWMRIDNYSHPIEDLAGAVVSARQDSVTLHDNAIAVITET